VLSKSFDVLLLPDTLPAFFSSSSSSVVPLKKLIDENGPSGINLIQYPQIMLPNPIIKQIPCYCKFKGLHLIKPSPYCTKKY